MELWNSITREKKFSNWKNSLRRGEKTVSAQVHRRVIRREIGFAGITINACRNSSSSPAASASSRRYVFSRRTVARLISFSEKRFPTHIRRPMPKGIRANGWFCSACPLSEVHRSGQNRCASLKYASSRQVVIQCEKTGVCVIKQKVSKIDRNQTVD